MTEKRVTAGLGVPRKIYQKQPAELAKMAAGSIRLITAAQLSEGYLERRGMIAYPRRYEVLRDNEDGTYFVSDPEFRLNEISSQ